MEKNGINFQYIDKDALKIKKKLIKKISFVELLKLLIIKKDIERISEYSPVFANLIFKLREKKMVTEIKKVAKLKRYSNIIVIVGADHKHRIYKSLRLIKLKYVKTICS